MTTLYIVRHGEARGNVERNFHGWFDSELTENGRAQISRLPSYFKDIKLDAAYSSDLKRTRETAEIVAKEKAELEEYNRQQSAKNDLEFVVNRAKVNKENEALLKQSMELLEFDMNLVKSMRQSPMTANYTKDAYNTYDVLPGGGFDVKR